MSRHFSSIAVATFVASFCAGCTQPDNITVAGAILTDGAHTAQGKRVPISQFSAEDTIVQLVDFTWPNPTEDAGRHLVVWNWYRDGKLVSRSGNNATHTTPMLFAATPWTVHTSRAAATLGVGHFEVDTVVDDHVVAASRFDIVR